jgi:uncharacterized tellurite resistance protein B-like protein
LFEELGNRPLIGKNSNCGIILAILFLFSFILLLINFGLFLLLILCQATLIFLDAQKIRVENDDIGPNPIIFGILAVALWIIIVPFYIFYRKRYENNDLITKKEINPISHGSSKNVPNIKHQKNIIAERNQPISSPKQNTASNTKTISHSQISTENGESRVYKPKQSSQIANVKKPESITPTSHIHVDHDKEFLGLCSKLATIIDLLNITVKNFNDGDFKTGRVNAQELIKTSGDLSKGVNAVRVVKYSKEKRMLLDALSGYIKFGEAIKSAIDSAERKDRESAKKFIQNAQDAANNANTLLNIIGESINPEKNLKTKGLDIKTDSSSIGSISWAGDSKEIRIHNYLIPNPLIYWTTHPVENSEASCIILDLPIGKPISETKGALGYWPRYTAISPDQRANYLDWLSSGRSEALSDIGYAFLFFYGLEYRGLIEKKDVPIIIQEVNSLLKKFTFSGSFNSYLSSFLAYISAINLSSISKDNFLQFFPNPLDLSYDQVLVALAWYTDNKEAIPWEVAYSLANTIPDTPKSVIVQKLSKQFKHLFETKFKSIYPNGVIFEPSLRKYSLKYRPASPSLLPYYQNYSKGMRIDGIEISNPLGKKSQFNKIFTIWNETIEELKPAARKIGKGEQDLTAQAYQALPDLLKQEIDHPDKSKWNEIFASSNFEGGTSFPSISSFAKLLQIEKRERLTPTQIKLLSSTARDVGYILIPDPRITGSSYRWDDKVAMYPLPDKKTYTSESYPTIAFILELGMSIALVDGVISQEEQDHLERFIFGSFELTPFDIECLKLYQQFLILNPPSLERLGTRLKEHLTDTNRLIIAKYLRDMASADGILESGEYKALNKIYKSMGLGKDDIQTLFPSDLTKKPSDQPIQVSQSSYNRTGEAIVPPPTLEPSFTLDFGLIDDVKMKSKMAQEILNEFINSDENEEYNSSDSIGADQTSKTQKLPTLPTIPDISYETDLPLIHPKYIPLLKEVTKPNSLTRIELQQICRNYRFMMDATIEEINTWSEEQYGDYLFENTDEDEISFNSDIKAKIQEDII